MEASSKRVLSVLFKLRLRAQCLYIERGVIGMESTNIVTHFRPIYILFIVILIITLFIMIFRNRHKVINTFTIAIITLISFAVSAHLTYQIGYLADELGTGGDAVSFNMFIAVVILSLVNLLIYAYKRE